MLSSIAFRLDCTVAPSFGLGLRYIDFQLADGRTEFLRVCNYVSQFLTAKNRQINIHDENRYINRYSVSLKYLE